MEIHTTNLLQAAMWSINLLYLYSFSENNTQTPFPYRFLSLPLAFAFKTKVLWTLSALEILMLCFRKRIDLYQMSKNENQPHQSLFLFLNSTQTAV